MPEVNLRERGVYTLPDGTQVVVCADGGDHLDLFYLTDWTLFGGDELRAARDAMAFRILKVTADGLIRRFGHPTDWRLADLHDTGRTVS